MLCAVNIDEELKGELLEAIESLKFSVKEVPTWYKATNKELAGIKIVCRTVYLQIGIYGGTVTISPFNSAEHAAYFKHLFMQTELYKNRKAARSKLSPESDKLARLKERAPRKGSYASQYIEQARHIEDLKSLVEQLSAEFFENNTELKRRLTELSARVAGLEAHK